MLPIQCRHVCQKFDSFQLSASAFVRNVALCLAVDVHPRLHCAVMGNGPCPMLSTTSEKCIMSIFTVHLLMFMSRILQSLLKKRSMVARSMEEQQQSASISQPLRRCLGPVDVLLLGLGSILGAGGFVLTGLAAHDDAGCASQPVEMVLTWLQAFSAM